MRTLAPFSESSCGLGLVRAVIAILGLAVLLTAAAAVMGPALRQLVAFTESARVRLQVRAEMVE